MATVHFIQQGKGGVGKSMIAATLYQVLMHNGKNVYAFDTDPVNSTLAGYKEFAVTRLDILRGDNIDQRAFDALVESIIPLDDSAHVIVDNGASSFISLSSYIRENDALAVFSETGHKVYFHTVITGGQAIQDTLAGMKALCVNFPTTPIVVWLNPFFGEIEVDGKGFEEFSIYKEFQNQLAALIPIPTVNASTTGKDLEDLFAKRQSFEAGINSSKGIMVRSRIKKYWNDLLNMLSPAEFVA